MLASKPVRRLQVAAFGDRFPEGVVGCLAKHVAGGVGGLAGVTIAIVVMVDVLAVTSFGD